MPSDSEHVKYLQWLLDRKSWERKDVAEKIGATKDSLSRWLSGERAPGKAMQGKIEALAAANQHPFPVDSDLPAGVQRDPYTGRTWPKCQTEFRFSDFWGGFLPPLHKYSAESIVLMFHEMIYMLTQNKVCMTRQAALDMFLEAYEERCRIWWKARFVDGEDWRRLDGALHYDDSTRIVLFERVLERLFPLGVLGAAATSRSPQHLEEYMDMHCWMFRWNLFRIPNTGLYPCNGVERLPDHCKDSSFDWDQKIWVAA